MDIVCNGKEAVDKVQVMNDELLLMAGPPEGYPFYSAILMDWRMPGNFL